MWPFKWYIFLYQKKHKNSKISPKKANNSRNGVFVIWDQKYWSRDKQLADVCHIRCGGGGGVLRCTWLWQIATSLCSANWYILTSYSYAQHTYSWKPEIIMFFLCPAQHTYIFWLPTTMLSKSVHSEYVLLTTDFYNPHVYIFCLTTYMFKILCWV